jgi:hypothetical protein
MPIDKIPKEDVFGVIAKLGPCQPIDIRKELKLGDSFLIGALLSELVADGKLAITQTRRGGSPFYCDPNAPETLEKISKYLNEKDQRTLALLREKKVLREDEQEPLVRVGLKSIDDFSKKLELDGVAYWRYFLTSEADAIALIKGAALPPPAHEKSAEPAKPRKKKAETKLAEAPDKAQETVVQAKEKEEAPKESKPKRSKKLPEPVVMPDGAVMISPQEWLAHDTLYEKVERFAAGLKLRDARVHKPHSELTCIVTIDSQFGAIDAFVHAFNKKFTADDVKTNLSRARELGLPIIVLSVDAVPSKVSTIFKGMPNIIFKRLEEK